MTDQVSPDEVPADEGQAAVEAGAPAEETQAEDSQAGEAQAEATPEAPGAAGSSASDEDADEGDELDGEGDIAADYLEELLDIADLDGDIDTYTEGGRAHVSIVTDTDVLVGKDGEVLAALQELSRLAVMTETGHRSRLMLDIGGHREKRVKELQNIARDAIAEVKETGEKVRLQPMNPFERKVVHDVVAEQGLTSESEGVEPKRCVVILPA
ncbi:protein jag [Aestuariimicrobium soli]|uniref:Jag family protein n=1 Tax=Aestuariimicrobium soli TaxID=2035834 RepID=UPI003EC1141E